MKETGGISKSQTYGGMKKGTCVLCGKDVSKLSWERQQDHAKECLARQKRDKKQTRLFA